MQGRPAQKIQVAGTLVLIAPGNSSNYSRFMTRVDDLEIAALFYSFIFGVGREGGSCLVEDSAGLAWICLILRKWFPERRWLREI